MKKSKGPRGAVGRGGVNPAPRAEDMTVRAAAEQLISVAIADLMPYAGNARTHSPEQIQLLRRSLREFGFVAPVLIDFDNNIIAGHGRVEAAKAEGMTEVPCVLVSNLSDAQRRAYILADNRLAELSGWDSDRLRLEMEELAALSFDTALIGFDMSAPPPLRFGPVDDALHAERIDVGECGRRLREYGRDPLDDATLESLRRRANAARYVYYSFSGGRDSTRALMLTYRVMVDSGKHVEILYVDNGYELPDLRCHILRVCKQLNAELRVLHSDIDYLAYYQNKNKQPDSIHRDCIELTINRPIDRYIMEQTGGEDYVLIRGGRPTQRTALSATQLYQTVKAKPHMIIWNPLFEMDLDAMSIPIPEWSGYARGFDRTACWCCPFQRPSQWQALRQWYPALHDELQLIFEQIPFRRHPGDGYLSYITKYWVEKIGASVAFLD